MRQGIIYVITNSINGHQYVGQTIKTIETRFHEHVNNSHQQKKISLISHAIKIYGEDKFTHSILEECDEQFLNEKEIDCIKSS